MKGQDILVALALAASGRAAKPGYQELADRLGVSVSEAHAAVKRLQEARLVDHERRVNRRALAEFVLHGLRYVFPAEPGAPSLGIATGPSAPGVREAFDAPELWVWPTPEGDVRGPSIAPLYPSVPAAARRDPRLYELLSLVDCLRVGRARERAIATKRLKTLLEGAPSDGDS